VRRVRRAAALRPQPQLGAVQHVPAPLVVILIDLLARGGWALALDRLIDTLLGCAIVLLVGYAPWPSSWHAHLPQRFTEALDSVARYTG
jgi:uncharacterized membrane protein YccC